MIKTIRIAFGFMIPQHQKLFFVLIVAVLANALMETASLGVLFPVIFSILDPEAVNSIPVIKEFLDTYAPVRGREFILITLVLVCVGFVIKNGISAFFLWIRLRYVEAVGANISNRMFRKYMGEEFEKHLGRSTDVIVRDLTQIISYFKGGFLTILLEFSIQLTIGLGTFIFLLFVDTSLTLYFTLIMVVVMLPIVKKVRTLSRKYGTEFYQTGAEYNQVVLRSFNSYKEIQVLKRQGFFITLSSQILEKFKRIHTRYGVVSGIPRLLLETVIMVLAISAMAMLFSENQSPQFIIAKLGIFGFAALKLIPTLNGINTAISSLSYSHEGIVIINDILSKADVEPEIKNRENIPFKKSITLKNLHYHYFNEKGKPVPVLKGIDITIKKNTSIGLVGSSGSGKTTLVDIIIGLLHPREGEIIIDGKSLQQEGVRGVWTDRIGYIPQQISLSNSSVKENVALGIVPEDIDLKQVNKVLEVAQLKSFVDGLSHGLDTKIGEGGIKLSGGQRQRIGIARALYHEPDILILDEATSALDNETERDFITNLSQLNKKTTQIIIAHRLTTVKNCDRIYVLHQGKVAEEGTYRTLERKGTYFRKMLLKKVAREN